MSLELFAGCQTQADVTKRYRELAKKCHPDRGGSTEAMQELNEARRLACQSLAYSACRRARRPPVSRRRLDTGICFLRQFRKRNRPPQRHYTVTTTGTA